MGFWLRHDGSEITNFSEACEQMADMLLERAGVAADMEVLDVAVGCGSQIRLTWQKVPALAFYMCVSYEKDQFQISQKIVRDLPNLQSQKTCLVNESAESWNRFDSIHAQWDRILVLDAIYHWNRWDWLYKAIERLKSKGIVVFTDLVVSSTPSRLTRLVSYLTGANLMTMDMYRSKLALYDAEVTIEDLSPHVFGHLANHIDRQKDLWRILGVPWWTWGKYELFGRYLKYVAASKELLFVLVTLKRST